MAKMPLNHFMTRLNLALTKPSVYMWGCFGHSIDYGSGLIITQKAAQYYSWYTNEKIAYLQAMVGQGRFGFDCVNLIKGILWGWSAKLTDFSGGAAYGTQGVPDTNANGFFNLCTGKSSNFSNVPVGAILWTPGHVGVYRGNNEAVECTPRWSDGNQVTGVRNRGDYRTKSRTWTQWGLAPYIDYGSVVPVPEPEPEQPEDTTPVPDDHLHPDYTPIGYGKDFVKTFQGVYGFQPLGSLALYTMAAEDITENGLPLFDEDGSPVPDGAVCEVHDEYREFRDLYRKAFGSWWKYAEYADTVLPGGYPASPINSDEYPVQMIAFDFFSNEVKLMAMKETAYQRLIFDGGHFSITGRFTERIDAMYCVLSGGVWGKQIKVGAPGWTITEIYYSTHNVYQDKAGTVVLFPGRLK